MALTYGEGIYGDAAGVVTPLDHRLAQVTEWVKTTTANLIRAGLLYNGTSTIVSGTAGMSYDVAAFSAVSTRGASQGAVPFANAATTNVATTAAPGSNSRYDVVFAWPRDFALDGTDSDPVLGVENGTAAASPTVPSLAAYPGAIELARILVPAGVTATNSGTTITQTAPFTAVNGGKVAFRNTTEMNLWTTALTDQLALDLSTQVTYRYNGSAWKGWESPWISQASPFNAGVTVGSGTVSAYYRYVAGAVEMFGKFVFGAGSAFTASVKLSPPVAMDSVYYGTQNIIIEGDIGFQDVGTNYYLGWAFSGASTTALELFVQNASSTYTNGSTISSTVPMTWATGDTLSWHLSYKAA